MNLIILSLIAAYFGVIFLVSLKTKEIKGLAGFIKAKQTLGIIAVFSGLVITHYGGGFVLGGAELGYKHALYGSIYGVSAGIGLLVLGFLIAKRFQKLAGGYKEKGMEVNTIPDYIFLRFGSRKLASLAAILSIITLIGLAAAQIFAAGKVFSVLKIPEIYGQIILTAIIILVAAKGIKTLTRVGTYNILIATIGGISALALTLPYLKTAFRSLSSATTFTAMSPSDLLWVLVPTVMYTIIGQDFHQKIYAAKSTSTARTACMLGGLFLIGLAFIPAMIGMAARSLFPNITAAASVPQLIVHAFPSGLVILQALFIAAVLAAVMGSAQSIINAAAAHFSNDLYRVIKPNTKDTKLHNLSRLSVIVFAILALIIGSISQSIVGTLIIAYTVYTASMFIPIMVGLYWSRVTTKAAIAAAIVGIVVALVGEVKLVKFGAIPSIIVGSLAALGVIILVSLLSKEKITEFH